MKKTYIRPEIIIENFTLSSQIASCGDIIRFSEIDCAGKNDVEEFGGAYSAMEELGNAFTGDGRCTDDYKILLESNDQLCYNGLTAPFNS